MFFFSFKQFTQLKNFNCKLKLSLWNHFDDQMLRRVYHPLWTVRLTETLKSGFDRSLLYSI